nr:uncharacterized protein LOC127321165 [Lolium perenne]
MCFEFGCFGGGRREDYGGERPARKELPGRGRRRSRGNRTADHKAPSVNQPHAVAADEAGHKAYHDGAWKDHHAAGVNSGYTAYAQNKAEYDNPKLLASHNKVGGNTGYTYAPAYTYTGRLHQDATDHKKNAPMDYHHYPTTTTNTSLVRY